MFTLNNALTQAITATTAELMALNFSVFIGTKGAVERRVECLTKLTNLVLAKMELESKDLLTPDLVGDPDPDHDEFGVGWEDLSDPVEGDYEF